MKVEVFFISEGGRIGLSCLSEGYYFWKVPKLCGPFPTQEAAESVANSRPGHRPGLHSPAPEGFRFATWGERDHATHAVCKYHGTVCKITDDHHTCSWIRLVEVKEQDND